MHIYAICSCAQEAALFGIQKTTALALAPFRFQALRAHTMRSKGDIALHSTPFHTERAHSASV